MKKRKCVPKDVGELGPVEWTKWTTWIGCSVCGTGDRTRERVCNKTCDHDVRQCPPDPKTGAGKKESQPCPMVLCQQDCLSKEEPMECNAECDGKNPVAKGEKVIKIVVITSPTNGGVPCPEDRKEPCSKNCTGDYLRERVCIACNTFVLSNMAE